MRNIIMTNVEKLLNGENLFDKSIASVGNDIMNICLEEQENGEIYLHLNLISHHDYVANDNGCIDINFSIDNINKEGVENLLKNNFNKCMNEYHADNNLNTLINRCIKQIQE